MEVHGGNYIFIERLDMLASDVKGQYIFCLTQAILRKNRWDLQNLIY